MAVANQSATTLSGLLSDLKKSKPFSCCLIYGDEDYLVNDALHKIIDALLPPGDRELSLFYMDGEMESQDAIRESVLTPSLLSGTKIVVVRNLDALRPKTSGPQAITKVLDLMAGEPVKAAKQFMVFLKKAGWNIEDLQNGNWKRIPDADWKKLITPDEFEQRENWLPRILDLCSRYEPTQAADSAENGLEDALRTGMPTGNCLIFVSDSVDKRKGLYKTISETGAVLDFTRAKNRPKQKEIAVSVSREILAKSGKVLSPAAFESLGRRTGFDLKKMTAEVEKLAAYSGDKTAIDEKDIELLVDDAKEDSVFALTGAIADRNPSKAVRVFKDLLEQGLHPLMIFTMITREIRTFLYAKFLLRSDLLKAYRSSMEYFQFQKNVYPGIKEWGRSDAGSSEIGGLHPYVLYNALRNSGRFSLQECVDYMDLLLETDVALKSTGQDPALMIERLVIVLCEGPAKRAAHS